MLQPGDVQRREDVAAGPPVPVALGAYVHQTLFGEPPTSPNWPDRTFVPCSRSLAALALASENTVAHLQVEPPHREWTVRQRRGPHRHPVDLHWARVYAAGPGDRSQGLQGLVVLSVVFIVGARFLVLLLLLWL